MISSSLLLVGVLLFGIPLAAWRPYLAFLLAAFVSAAFPTGDLAQSRTTLGGQFNAIDATLLVAMIGMMIEGATTRRLKIPEIAVIMLILLVIAFAQTGFKLGITYDTSRALRWAVTFPLYFIIADNMIINEQRVQQLILVLFLGAVIVSLQSVIFVSSRLDMYGQTGSYGTIRGAKFIGTNIFILLAMMFWPLPVKFWQKAVYIASGLLFLTTVILSQTRSAWIALVASIPLMLILFRRTKNQTKKIMLILLLSIIAFSLISTLIPALSSVDLVTYRLRELSNPEGTTLSRRIAMDYEWQAWLNSPLLIGQGLSYFQKDYGGEIAVNHLGYLTYLAQLGLVGFLIYGIYIPLAMIKRTVVIYHENRQAVSGRLAMLAGATILYSSVVFFLSGSLLSHSPIPGLLAGSIWAISNWSERPSDLWWQYEISKRSAVLNPGGNSDYGI